MQETALRVWQSAGEIHPNGRAEFLLRWAVTVARNLARDLARRAGRELPIEDGHDPPSHTPCVPADPALRKQIRRCQGELPPKPAAAIRLRILHGAERSDRELAGLAGISFDSFRQNLARGRGLLEKCLERAGIDLRRYLA